MYGAAITKDGEVVSEHEFSVIGWKLDYLLLDDRLLVDIDFTDNGSAAFLDHAETISGAYFSLSPSYFLTYYSAYHPSGNTMTGGYFALSTDYDCCLLTTNDGLSYIGSIDPDYDPKAIMAVFEQLIG